MCNADVKWKRKCVWGMKLTATISGASDTKPHSLRRRTLPLLFPLPMLQIFGISKKNVKEREREKESEKKNTSSNY